MEFNELLQKLQQDPADWEARTALAQAYFEAEQYPEAAQLIADAPEVPFDEENVLFAATILGTAEPESGHNLLDQFIANQPTEGAYELKAQLFEMSGDAESAAICRSALANGSPGEATAEPVAVESTPEVATPKKLRPPGEEDEESLAEHPAVSPAPVVVNQQPLPEVDEEPLDQHPAAGAALMVAPSGGVHAVEAQSSSNDKLGAVTAAIIVHVILIVMLYFVKDAIPRPTPPQITASSVANADSASLESKTMTKQTQKSVSQVSSAQPVVSATAFSSFAIPDVPDAVTDFTMAAMSDSDAGFGMSMTGFSDVSNMGAIPASMRSRCSMSERMKRLRQSGGEDRAERAVRKGLEFLVSHQSEDGGVGKHYRVGMTGLTLLALLGHCETPESAKFGDSVVKSALFLMNTGFKEKGQMRTVLRPVDGKVPSHHMAYEHAIATYALAELYTMTRESGNEIPRLGTILKKALEVITEGQDQPGGWTYGFKGGDASSDMSVSGWNIQALKAGYNAYRASGGKDIVEIRKGEVEEKSALDRDKDSPLGGGSTNSKGVMGSLSLGKDIVKTLDKAVKDYLPKNQDRNGGFRYNFTKADAGKPTLTGAALLGMQIWDQMGSGPYKKGLAFLHKSYPNPSPNPGGHGFYDEYYNTQVYFMHGGKEWEKYNTAFQPKLLDSQHEDGSWKVGGEAKDAILMNTAWAVLMLEVYYRYLPTTDKVKDLKVE